MSVQSVINKVNHPLEPLTAEEITKAVAILKQEKTLLRVFAFAQSF